jgi:DNA-binding MltR family transcriptional regulator
VWSVTSRRELAAIEELQSNPSDRAVGIVIASFVEMHLTDLIKSFFIKEKETKKDAATVANFMFQPTGPIGAFASKIRLAYLMGVISEECFKDLANMKEIRNKFAHYPQIGQFSVPTIRDKCKNFKMVDRYVIDPPNGIHGDPSALFGMERSNAAKRLQNPKERYVLSAQIFCIGLQHATPRASTRHSRF